MALVFDATPKGAAANSYVTEAEAAAYFDGRQNADAWIEASPDDRKRVLVTATTRLEQRPALGSRTTSTQRLKWPRRWVYDDEGTAYDADLIPRPLQEATCELALDYLRRGTLDPLASDDLDGVESLTIGPLSLSKAAAAIADSDLSTTVRRLLGRLSAAGASTFRIVRA